jgi:hypothetical protein
MGSRQTTVRQGKTRGRRQARTGDAVQPAVDGLPLDILLLLLAAHLALEASKETLEGLGFALGLDLDQLLHRPCELHHFGTACSCAFAQIARGMRKGLRGLRKGVNGAVRRQRGVGGQGSRGKENEKSGETARPHPCKYWCGVMY